MEKVAVLFSVAVIINDHKPGFKTTKMDSFTILEAPSLDSL